MNNAIERDVFVLRDMTAVAQPIEYVQGTNAIPLVFHIRDYEVPSGATVRVYIKKPSTKAEYDTATLDGNTVTVDVKDTMFLELGLNFVQIAIASGEKTLVTFEYPVQAKRNNVAGELPESENNSNFLDDYIAQLNEIIANTEELMEASDEAMQSATEAESSATAAGNYATEAESVAHGGTGTRQNEDTDNAMYYYEQAQSIAQGLNGALLPMGTIPFAQLATVSKDAGYMYNISDDFTTDSTFKEGAGHSYPAGTNVYYTGDGLWDCLAGSFVTGVKGNKEPAYRQGNVNLTPENIGAVSNETFNAFTADLINLVYPIGSIYMSTNNVSPATFLGGTWEQIKDKFLLSAGDTHSAGETGGAESVTLATANLPSHSHGLNSHRHSIPALSGTAASGGSHQHNVDMHRCENEASGYGLDLAGGFTDRVMINHPNGMTVKAGGAHTHSVTTTASNTGNASGNTSNTGSGTAHNNMPPYLAVYMWKRTA